MQHILLPALEESSAYCLNHDGQRWTLTTLAVDHRTATGEFAVRFGPVVGYGVHVQLSASIGLVPGMQTVLTVIDGENGGDDE